MDGIKWYKANNKKKENINYKNTFYSLFPALVPTPAAAALVLPRKQNPQIRRLHLQPYHQVSSDTEKREHDK